MNSLIYSLISVIIVSLLSLVGALFLTIGKEKLQKILLILVSFAAGSLLGDVFIHLLPEVIERGFDQQAALLILTGLLLFFILEKFICWRHCHVPTSPHHPHPVAFMNLIGDGLHNFLDGMIIAASYLVSFNLGVATSLAVVFHEIPQEIGDFGILVHGGFSQKKALILNFSSALLAVFGALVVLLVDQKSDSIAGLMIPFTAGGFLYIAGSDLIPELHKETRIKESILQFLGLIVGIGLMFGLTLIE